MKIRFLAMMMIGLCGAGVAAAQTLYNAPGQSGATTVQPLNLRELMRQEQAARAQQQAQPQSTVPYAAAPNIATGANFGQRLAALNQWRSQRDAQAQADQQRSQDYMVAMADAPNALTFGVEPSQQAQRPSAPTAVPQQPTGPLIYRGARDDAPIQTPRRLFNTPD